MAAEHAGYATRLCRVRRAPPGRGATGRGPRRGGGAGVVAQRAVGGGGNGGDGGDNGGDGNDNNGGNGQSAYGAALRRAQRLNYYRSGDAGKQPRLVPSPPSRASTQSSRSPANIHPPGWAPPPAPVPHQQLHPTAKQAKAKARRLIRLEAAAGAASGDDGDDGADDAGQSADAEVEEPPADGQGEASGLRVAVMGGGALFPVPFFLVTSTAQHPSPSDSLSASCFR